MSLFADYMNRVSLIFRPDSRHEWVSTWSGAITTATLITECPFVVFDTELSGLNPRRDFIVSIGAVKMTGGLIHAGRSFLRFVKPTGEMTKKSIEIHGITPDDLQRAEEIESVLPEFLEFISDSVLIGHFLYIDLRFLNAALKRLSVPPVSNPAVDTHTLHEWLLQNSSEFKNHFRGACLKTDLFSVAERYGITVDTAHDALNDAFITAQLFQRFIRFLGSHGIKTLGELVDIGRA